MTIRIWTEYDTSTSPAVLKLYEMGEAGVNKVQQTLPSATKGTNIRPAYALMNNRRYLAGAFSNHLVRTEYGEWKRSGLEAPGESPTITASGTGDLTGEFTPYTSYADIADDGTVLVESNLVKGDPVDFAGAGSRVWGSIPSSGPERATHVRGWVAFQGALPKLAWTRKIGTTAVTESMSTAFLARQPLPPNDGRGSVVFNNNPPPYTQFCAVYHRRMFYAGDPNYPYRLWYSELDRPENVGALSFFDMRDRETIKGIIVFNDTLLIFCVRAIYELQGWADGQDGVAPDMEVRKVITGIGSLAHHSLVDINDRIWFASEDGIRVFDGSPRLVNQDIFTYYRDDLSSNRAKYDRCMAINSKRWQCYILLVPKSSAHFYVGYYKDTDPATGGDGRQPYWSFDTLTREIDSINVIYNSNGEEVILYGGCDGYLRAEDSSNTDDDSDSAGKLTHVQTRHEMLGQLSADKGVGWDVTEVHNYLETENQATTLRIFTGDESIADLTESATANDSNTIPASSSAGMVALTRFKHRAKSASGSGFTLVWRATGLDSNWRWRGYGFVTAPGRKRRRVST